MRNANRSSLRICACFVRNFELFRAVEGVFVWPLHVIVENCFMGDQPECDRVLAPRRDFRPKFLSLAPGFFCDQINLATRDGLLKKFLTERNFAYSDKNACEKIDKNLNTEKIAIFFVWFGKYDHWGTFPPDHHLSPVKWSKSKHTKKAEVSHVATEN